MKKEELQNTIRMGLIVPASYLKRGSWNKIERVMEYLVKKGYVVRKDGDIKYAKKYHDISVETMATAYLRSPFMEHLDEYKKLGEELHLPLNSGTLLRAFNNIAI